MLFFADGKQKDKKVNINKPRTIGEIKKLQNFVKSHKTEQGKSLNESIQKMARRDESFNEFLKNFKAKNEQNWANIVDLTQLEQEDRLLEKTEEYRKNEMKMLEEFRRRSNLKDYYDLMKKKRKALGDIHTGANKSFEMSQENLDKHKEYMSMGPERFFENRGEEIFDTTQFTLIFIDSDSVTNVTSLNRVNHRRVLIFIGNGNGLISFGKGKSEDYEGAFEQAFKKLR